jgi:hypothetical protein
MVLVGVLVGAVAAVAACGGGSPSSQSASRTVPARTVVHTTTANTTTSGGTAVSVTRPVRRKSHAPIVTRLSAQQLAGQRIVYAYAGLNPPASLL